jgi:hypothetical protein
MSHPETFPVKVTVANNGTPIEGAVVSFVNTRAKDPSGSGLSAADGTVRITTFEQGDGLVPGDYKVTVRKQEVKNTVDPARPNDKPIRQEIIWHVPQKYASIGSSPFTAVVEKGGPNTFQFNVQ